MPALINSAEIHLFEPIKLRFGFSGLSQGHATPIIRELIKEGWPENRRYEQCVYVIRLTGEVAVSYNDKFSPVIYIGEGNAFGRLYSHASWISNLLVSVPNTQIEISIAQVRRKNHPSLYQYIEADMLRWFSDDYQALPWFNKQREPSKEGAYEYDAEARRKLYRTIRIGSGHKFLWAIKPLPTNDQYLAYAK